MIDITKLYCNVDDFWNNFQKEWDKHLLDCNKSKRGPVSELSMSEMMTIVIFFHQSNFRTFKHFYLYFEATFTKEFPKLISYSRFVYNMKTLFIPLFAYLIHTKGKVTGISFIDATSIKVCHNKRICRNRTFKGLAKTGKTTAGWFHGFKLHLVINEIGEILAFQLTPGNVSDLSQADILSKNLIGKLFADKGYISSALTKRLWSKGVQLVTSIRSNMKQKLLTLKDKILLRKRAIIETVNDQLKNISQIEHTRHRSIGNFFVNLLSGLAAYTLQPKKPSLCFNPLALAS